MSEADAVELVMDKAEDGIGGEGVEPRRVGDTVFDVGVLTELECGVELGVAEEDEVVVFGEVF